MNKAEWLLQPLGEEPDVRIAERLGVSRERVRQVRVSLGIPRPINPRRVFLDQSQLGTVPDSQIARRYECSPSTVKRQRCQSGILKFSKVQNWNEQPLGEMSDYALGKLLGVSHQSVRWARIHRGIEPFQPKAGIDWDAQPLGKLPDTWIARLLGVSGPTVFKARVGRGIPAFKVKK